MIQIILLALVLLCFVPVITQPKCPKCKRKSILMYNNKYRCVKCEI